MYFIHAIVGALVGAFAGGLAGDLPLGALSGAVFGLVLARLGRFEERIRRLEAAAGTAQRRAARGAGAEPARPPGPEAVSHPGDVREAEPFEEPAEPEPAGRPDRPVTGPAPGPWPERVGEIPPRAAARAGPSRRPLDSGRVLAWLKNWLTTGNVPVKVGVIVSFIGVSFLLKYAVDHELLALPLEFRLLGVALAGAALVAIGWRLRERMRVYALSLQGGGAGILFLTIFAALRLWQLLPVTLAFVLLVALAVFTGALAVLQNSRALAVLGIVGGFLAPVLASTGQGSHVVLFSYYLVLSGAVLGIAWFRAWRELNLVGFVFTFLISGWWGYQYFRPALFASTEPFLLLYFLFYQAIAVLYALRQPPDRLGVVDGTLVFGAPVIAFALQSRLVHGMDYGLAASAAGVAVFYAITATWLYRRQGAYLRLLTESFLALAVAFATIAIPLALDARWTSAAWALEGAALVWIGARQGRHLATLAGFLLVILSGLAFMAHGWRHGAGPPLLNGNVLGGLLISASALFASRRLDGFAAQGLAAWYRAAGVVLFCWGILWWAGAGWMEISDRVADPDRAAAFLLLMALSAAAAAWSGRARSWRSMQGATLAFLPVFALLAVGGWGREGHLLLGLGWLAWPVATVVQCVVLRELDARRASRAGAWHVATLFVVTAMFAFESSWWVNRVVSGAWASAAALSMAGVMALAVWRFRDRPAWPVPAHADSYLSASVVLVICQVTGLVWLSLYEPGNPAPLPYVPLLNPFDLGMLFSVATAMLSLRLVRPVAEGGAGPELAAFADLYRALLAVAFFIMTTAALVRGVHFYGSVPWRAEALFASVLVQTSLSIYWGLLGFGAMVLGARSLRRPLWMVGAGFMGLVVIKLFVVDLGNSGTVERIISFIGVGALLLLVGYIAPVPPRIATAEPARHEPERKKHET